MALKDVRPVSLIIGTVILSVFVLSVFGESKCKESKCEACCNMIEAFEKKIDDNDRKKEETLAKKLKQFCKETTVSEFGKICYNLGFADNTPTHIGGALTKPLTFHKPADKICEALGKMDSQICEVRIKKKLDLTKIDLKKLRVKQLKDILSSWDQGDACKGCAEKSDFIRKIEELMPKYDKKAYEARKKQEL